MSEYWTPLASSIDAASSAALGFKGEYDALQAQLDLTKASLNEAIKSNATLVAQRDEAVRDVNDLNAVVHDQTAQIELLTTQRRQLRATVALYSSQIAELKTRIAELEAQLTPGKRCELPIATVTAARGRWEKPGSPNVGVLNEAWNALEAGPQTLYVCDESSWFVRTNQPKVGLPKDSGSVKSYPCTQWLFPNKPLISSLKSLSLTYAHEMPTAPAQYNAAVDAWVGGLGEASTAEVMVWTDYKYPASLPPSNALKTAAFAMNGISYKAWTRKNKNGGDYIALYAQDAANMRSHGTLDLLAVFKWLQGIGWLKATDTLAAVNYGIEISHTLQTEQIFRMNENKLTWS